jgi:cytochrome c oxidase cbb3-type subunit 3
MALTIVLFSFACERERRDFNTPAANSSVNYPARMSGLQPNVQLPRAEAKSPYDGNAFAISEGQQLYGTYNCSGCHANGGGAIGPALMDDEWIYGGSSTSIHNTIVEGRPQGMPSYGGHIPDDQIWKIAAYVRSLSSRQPQSASPTRDEHMQKKRWENPK